MEIRTEWETSYAIYDILVRDKYPPFRRIDEI